MSRKFDIGRQNEVLMNSTHYDIFRLMQNYLNHPNDSVTGPETYSDSAGVLNGALWLDKYSDSGSADLKYFNNGVWNLLFADRFKLICDIMSSSEPTNPVEGQLWINSSGTLMYYKSGQFVPIKATLSDTESNTDKYEDFLVINPLSGAEHAVLNNFSKFLFTNTPIEKWKTGVLYSYQQGVLDSSGNLYVCCKEHYSTESIALDNAYYWSRVDTLIQYLLPNTATDKVFVNAKFLHEKEGSLGYAVEQIIYKEFGITFGNEDDSVIHDSLRFDVTGNNGYYDTATLVTDGSQVQTNTVVEDSTPVNTEEDGYITNTNVAIYIPEATLLRDKDDAGNYITDEYTYGSDTDYKLVTAVHINPIKIDKISKHFVKINKKTGIVPILKENTEFYAVKGGFGRLLLETTTDSVYDYCSALSDGNVCIKLADHIVTDYEYIYAIHYDFISAAKQPGILYRKKVQLNDLTSIYIGEQDPRNLCLFAQGLFYQQADNTYDYNYDTEYIEFKEKLLKSADERLDISILKFPNVFRGKITADAYVASNFIAGRGYRVDLNAIPYNVDHCLGFASGIQVDPKKDFVFYPDDTTAVYFPNFTKQYVIDHSGEIDWDIVETDWIENSVLTHSMYRGETKATTINSEVGIAITRDVNIATADKLYLSYLEAPIVFVDGIYISQNDLVIYEDYITVKGLAVDQQVILLADVNSNVTLDDIIEKTEIVTNVKNYDPSLALEEDPTNLKLIEDIKSVDGNVDILTDFIFEDLRYLHEIYDFSILSSINSDNVLFEDNISNVTIKTDRNDSTIVYLKDGLICDTDAVTVTSLPTDPYDGQVKHLFNTVQDEWLTYSTTTMQWEPIHSSELDLLKANAEGYTSYNNNITILEDVTDEKYCTCFSYVYSDTVEKSLLTGFVDPDGQMGINDGISDFELNVKHHYVPGRNELTVYLNGIRQNLTSPFGAGFDTALARECDITGSNTFALSIDNGTTVGQAINAADGYYTYKTVKNGFTDYIYKKVELTDTEIQAIKDSGTQITLVSSPNKNTIFYVIEPCETGETTACDRVVLTYNDALSSKGAYANNTYSNSSLNFNKGNIRVFINGLRQPYGAFQDINGNAVEAYKIVDSHTIQVTSPLVGGQGGNLGDSTTPLFPINPTDDQDFYKIIDEITVETRSDLTLRELTIPLKYGQTTFGTADGLPDDLFKTKDTILIYINGYAYGNTYTNEYKTITLLDSKIENLIDNSGNNYITFEWR